MTALYIHIPFCKKKCSYCDFVSYAGKEDLIDAYVEALIRELEFLISTFNFRLSTLFFGGGTPTLLKPKHFKSILSNIDYRISHPEITIEANPGTVSREYLIELRDLGINRISFGAQSFNDKHLQLLGRIHNSKEIFKAVDDAKSAGFENISLDLIFALPDQTLDEWKDDLQKAISLNPEHISTYNLQIEEGTPLFGLVTRGSLPVTSEDLDADMYEYTIETLAANNYKHYEISNFAKSGFECKHNINYWKMGNWLGIGAGAHSHVDGKHWANADLLEEYIETAKVTKPISSLGNEIFMGLRLIEGISTDKFKGFESQVKELKKDGLIEEREGHIRLTRKGLLLGNLVFERFV